MSLATRCTACGTVFRVVQDQLKVSEGWVRCGHCQEVFNALEALFDLEHESPPSDAGTSDRREPPDFVDTQAHEDPEPPSAWESDLPAAQAPAPPPEHRVAATPARPLPEPLAELLVDAPPAPVPEPPPSPMKPPAAPGFVQAAERAQRWQQPRVRAVLALTALALAATLAGQLAVQFREPFAARWPEARPALEILCGAVGCEIGPLRKLSALRVEASGLSPEGRADTFLLTMTLHNRDRVELAAPSVDLSLTDTRGTLIARRVLGPEELRRVPDGQPVGATLPPGAEWPVQVALQVENQPTSGYTVELFYP